MYFSEMGLCAMWVHFPFIESHLSVLYTLFKRGNKLNFTMKKPPSAMEAPNSNGEWLTVIKITTLSFKKLETKKIYMPVLSGEEKKKKKKENYMLQHTKESHFFNYLILSFEFLTKSHRLKQADSWRRKWTGSLSDVNSTQPESRW